ncbi:hypothetical protein IM816_06000 [Luteibacter flocculans]|uniref:DUF5666 domain-containing protein n=1 Tax=Luteibacter flocculans TaxID=2780091 RepID=A0ABY4T9V1_9GAMM|nr:hypothetical protein [Luteibacter flocculans]URL59649.1 hypothetical protein IM816_06000 [Luteibacter flocculans]
MQSLAKWLASLVFLALATSPKTASACDSGYWVQSVADDGGIIVLNDGTIWEVSSIDKINSALWLPMTEIVVCDDKLINVDDNETVEATRIK